MKIYPVANLFNGRIALSPHPQGAEKLDSEINFLQRQGYRLVVSMLTPEEQQKHQLTQEKAICESYQISYLNYPIRDEIADSDEETIAFVQRVKRHIDKLTDKDKILFHCRGGVGRSSIMIALVVASDEWPVDKIFALLTEARGETTPESLVQRLWVKQLNEYRLSYALP